MPCLYCHEYCGDQSFCGPDCYDAYEEAQAEYQAQNQCEPPESTMGNKGNI